VSDLGTLLRKARMDRKLSLDDLQELTKIRKAYLEAIEEGNYKMLPGNFYVRAFIKSYSEAVGLDPNEVLRMYQSVIPAPVQEPIVETIRPKRSGSRHTERFSKWASNFLMISFVVLILSIIYYYANLNYSGKPAGEPAGSPQRVTDKSEPPSPSASATGNPTPITETKTLPDQAPTPPPVSKTEVKLVNSERGTDYYAITNSNKIKIEMTIIGDACWLEVDSVTDKKVLVEQGTFTNGISKEWEIDSSAFMRVGKSNAIEIKINGVPIMVGDSPNPKSLQLDLTKS
jgi:cytoskeletal protein RodZ